jgi:hypothetical protein
MAKRNGDVGTGSARMDAHSMPDRHVARILLDQWNCRAYLRASDVAHRIADARSSNGKRADSDSVNQGSNPCRASKFSDHMLAKSTSIMVQAARVIYAPGLRGKLAFFN